MYSLIRPLLFQMDPERAHEFTLKSLALAYKLNLRPLIASDVKENPKHVMGLDFKNPVGLAAGLDKNGDYVEALSLLGFGFIEVGTTTPKPQEGNPKPRMFRLPGEQAIINRMGFNNKGVDYLVSRIKQTTYKGVLGINIGKNKLTPNEHAIDDYITCLQKVYPYADYITVNLSSPNTPGLRDLQFGDPLRHLLEKLKAEQAKQTAQYRKYVPLVIKVAPDMVDADIEDVAEALKMFEFDGVIATNTTISRPVGNNCRHADESGGLSGWPLNPLSTRAIEKFNQIVGPRIPIIGVGGIVNKETAIEKVDAGASLVQLYSGLIYQGPALVKAVSGALAAD